MTAYDFSCASVSRSSNLVIRKSDGLDFLKFRFRVRKSRRDFLTTLVRNLRTQSSYKYRYTFSRDDPIIRSFAAFRRAACSTCYQPYGGRTSYKKIANIYFPLNNDFFFSQFRPLTLENVPDPFATVCVCAVAILRYIYLYIRT